MVSSPPVQLPKTLRLTHKQFCEMVWVNPDLRLEQSADGAVIVMHPAGGEDGIRNAELTASLGI